MSNWLAVARDRLCPAAPDDAPSLAQCSVSGTAKTADISGRQAANDELKRVATSVEVAELRELIAEILANDTEAERVETLEIASRDPDAALMSFRELRHELRENRRWLSAWRGPR